MPQLRFWCRKQAFGAAQKKSRFNRLRVQLQLQDRLTTLGISVSTIVLERLLQLANSLQLLTRLLTWVWYLISFTRWNQIVGVQTYQILAYI